MIDRVLFKLIKMRAAGGNVYYDNQLGINLGDRMSFDQTVPYTLACNYKGYGDAGYTHKFCLIEAPGSYAVDADETKVLLSKDVSVVLSDCHLDLMFPSTVSGDLTFTISLYVGTTEDVLSSSTVYLYRWVGYLIPGVTMKLDIPDISGFVVPTGKNVVCVVSSSSLSHANGHFVSSIDD